MKASAHKDPASRRLRKLLVQAVAAAALAAAAFAGGALEAPAEPNAGDPTGIIDGR